MSRTTLRQSPSGRQLGNYGFALLGLSAAAPFLDGVPLVIPWDTEVENSGIGGLVDATLGKAFRVNTPGIYLVSLVVNSDDAVDIGLGLIGGTGGIPIGGSVADNVAFLSTSGPFRCVSLSGELGDILATFNGDGASANLTTLSQMLVQLVG
jgi:hypothetical protein